MLCGELTGRLEELSPLSYAEGWDNVGLLAGRRNKEIRSVLIALDATNDVITQAVSMRADLLLTHHPLLFKPMKSVTEDDSVGKRMLTLLQHDICYYAMHTNFDVMGMADAAADELGLMERGVLEITFEDDISREGIGRIGRLPERKTLEECAVLVKAAFGIEHLKVFGNADGPVERLAVVPGAGKAYIGQAIAQKADVIITGDIGHHDGIDANEQGIAVIDAGHFGLEKIFVPYMEEYLKREATQLKVYRAHQKCPYWII